MFSRKLPALGACLVALLSFGISGASASPIQTLTFSGTLQYGYDGSGLFGAANTSLASDAYSITFSYDPTSFTSSYSVDSCGAMSGSSCYFAFSTTNAPTEVVTIDGQTQTFVGTSGGFGFTAGTPDDINISVQGPGGLSFSGDFKGPAFFPTPSNVNDPYLSSFTDVTLTSGTWNSSLGSTSFGSNPTMLSAAQLSTVPEPMSIALIGTGLVGIGATRRRKGLAQT